MKTYADTLDDQIRVVTHLRSFMSSPYEQRLVDNIARADSYFLTDDFAALTFAAANQLPRGTLVEIEDFPSPIGWVSLERGITPMFGGAWVDDEDVWHETNDSVEGPPIDSFFWWVHEDKEHGGQAWRLFPFSDRADLATYPPETLYFDRSQDSTAERFIKAFFLLTSQKTISETSMEPAPRAFRKRAERAHVRPEVRVIRLPRRVRGSAGEPRSVDWQSRWIVSGHWRQQPWGPERKRIRPVWIAPYLKGPEDKPLVAPAHRLFVASAPE